MNRKLRKKYEAVSETVKIKKQEISDDFAGLKKDVEEKKEQFTAAAKRKMTEYLIREALDRNEPKLMKSIIFTLETVIGGIDNMRSLTECAEKLEAMPHERVVCRAEDGTRLVGHWFRKPGARRIVVAFHGWRSTWSRDFGQIAPAFLNNDCSVLFAEQRGQGESGGDYMGFGMLERYDCRTWLSWIAEKEPDLPVYLHGKSMGASTILMATGLDLPGRVCGLISDCGFTEPEAIWAQVAEDTFHISYEALRPMACELCRQKIGVEPGEYSTLTALRDNRLPILFVHGTDDHFVPYRMTEENFAACTAPKRLFSVEGADHGMSYFRNPKGYTKELLEFFREYDDFDAESESSPGQTERNP